MAEINVPGTQLLRATITYDCRAAHGDDGVADEVAARVCKAVRDICGWWSKSTGVRIHVVVTLEKPDPFKAELAEAKKRDLPAGWEMSATMVSRQDECERLTKENATLREQLAEATKPVEDREIDERTASVPVNTYGHCFVGVAIRHVKEFVQRERAARLAAEQRLALTREAWRHRWVDGGSNGRLDFPRTDADIDAAIAAHEKSKADAAGGPQ